MSILLKGGTVVSAYNRRQLDIRIDGDKSEMGANLPVKILRLRMLRGVMYYRFIDAHTHLELNNGKGSLSTADNFTTGSGGGKGTTTVIDMATPNKGGSLKDCLATWNQLAEGKSSCDYTICP